MLVTTNHLDKDELKGGDFGLITNTLNIKYRTKVAQNETITYINSLL